MKVVYIDLLFITNLIPDYLLLRITATLLGRYVRWWRQACGAAFAAACALPLYLLPMSTYLSLCIKALVCLLVCLITFGRHRLANTCTLFCAMSFAFAGGVSAVCWLGLLDGVSVRGGALYANLSLPMLICASLLAYCVMRLVFSCGEAARGGRRAKAEITLLNKTLTVSAYRDSGNTLHEPFTGKGVLVLSPRECMELVPDDAAEVLRRDVPPLGCFEELGRMYPGVFSLIPYSTAGNSGLMVCIKPDLILIDGKKDHRIVGISHREITINGCSAVIGV